MFPPNKVTKVPFLKFHPSGRAAASAGLSRGLLGATAAGVTPRKTKFEVSSLVVARYVGNETEKMWPREKQLRDST